MSENYFILAGGIGNRLQCLDIPKALAPIPSKNGMESILDRIIRLRGIGQYVLCLGWHAQLFNERYTNLERFITYDVDNPTGAAMAVKMILEHYNCHRYVILLGDVVWSKRAMDEFKTHTTDKDIVFYHDKHRGYSETFALSIHHNAKDSIIQALSVDTLPSLPGERRQYGFIDTPIDRVRLGGLEKVIVDNHWSNYKRIYTTHSVDDIDTDEQYKQVIVNLLGGLYG